VTRGKRRLWQCTIYLDPDEDQALITWLQSRRNQSAAGRDLLLDGFRVLSDRGGERGQAGLDPATIVQAIEQALTERLNPALFRQIVEAGVRDALGDLSLTPAQPDSFDERAAGEPAWLASLSDDVLID